MTVLLPLVLGVVFLGLLVHVASLLALPLVSEADVTGRFAATLPLNAAVPLLADTLVGAGLPWLDPAFAVAACRYDLAKGVLRIRAPATETLLLVSAVNKGGGVYLAVSDRAAVKGAIDLLVGTEAQIDTVEANDKEDEPVGELRVRAPGPRGVVFFRVLAPTPGQQARAREAVAAGTCGIETL